MISCKVVFRDSSSLRRLPESLVRSLLPGGTVATFLQEMARLEDRVSSEIGWSDDSGEHFPTVTSKSISDFVKSFYGKDFDFGSSSCFVGRRGLPTRFVSSSSFHAWEDFFMLTFGSFDSLSNEGLVAIDVRSVMLETLREVVLASSPTFGYIYCAKSNGQQNSMAGDPLSSGRREFTPDLLDGYSWIVALSPELRARLTNPKRLSDFAIEELSTSSGQFLVAQCAPQPAEMTPEILHEWKAALHPLLPGPPWEHPVYPGYGDVPWILDEDQVASTNRLLEE
jgi:hypothetical protein